MAVMAFKTVACAIPKSICFVIHKFGYVPFIIFISHKSAHIIWCAIQHFLLSLKFLVELLRITQLVYNDMLDNLSCKKRSKLHFIYFMMTLCWENNLRGCVSKHNNLDAT